MEEKTPDLTEQEAPAAEEHIEEPDEKPARKRARGGVTRRDVCLGAGAIVALLAFGGVRYLGQAAAVRPPGGQDEDHLMSACVRCGKCIQVCPHHIIKPMHVEDGLMGVRTPYLDFNEAWCDWCADANGGVPLCAEVCPTRALALPAGASAETLILGKAVLRTDWCLAYKKLSECRWCYNACPYEAIVLDDYQRPVVVYDRCNGCGACQSACISLESGSLSDNMDAKAITVAVEEEAMRA